jgi:phosphate starvation-inducible membrane PsiE
MNDEIKDLKNNIFIKNDGNALLNKEINDIKKEVELKNNENELLNKKIIEINHKIFPSDDNANNLFLFITNNKHIYKIRDRPISYLIYFNFKNMFIIYFNNFVNYSKNNPINYFK